MKKSELAALIAAAGDDDDIDELIKPKEPPAQDLPPANPPANPPKKDIKSDTVISMTAAEFMQLFADKNKADPPKEKDDDAEIFI